MDDRVSIFFSLAFFVYVIGSNKKQSLFDKRNYLWDFMEVNKRIKGIFGILEWKLGVILELGKRGGDGGELWQDGK